MGTVLSNHYFFNSLCKDMTHEPNSTVKACNSEEIHKSGKQTTSPFSNQCGTLTHYNTLLHAHGPTRRGLGEQTGMTLVVCLYGLLQYSLLELTFGVELDSDIKSLHIAISFSVFKV